MVFFYDTNILLENNIEQLNNDNIFYISNITIEELENIKTSSYKSDQIKFKARQAVRWLVQNQNRYNVVIYNQDKIKKELSGILKDLPIDPDSNDKKIILSALYIKKKNSLTDLIFKTQDLNCYLIAKQFIQSEYNFEPKKEYFPGYRKIFCNTQEELANLYNKIFSKSFTSNFKNNEYILIYNPQGEIIDKYKYQQKGKFLPVRFSTIESKMFGTVKPLDAYQQLAIDSLKTNSLTLLQGPAGTGKSLLSMAYLFQLLQQGQINKIIIFCNTVATAGSAKLGYYPGRRVEKLLDSQIGNFLISKLGAREEVENLIDKGQLVLLPMSDIRGFDTSGMKAGIYITQAQNLNINLMRLALQRIGEDSICILDGDFSSQVDLPIYAGKNNGLKRVSEVFRGQPFYGEVTLQTIHRSKIAEIANKM